ncbi:MAG: IS66 family transposase [Streptosporangiaceae bacterium]
MPDVPAVPDEVAALRAANARLRQVVEAKDTEMGLLRQQVEALAAQVAELRARLGQNPRNSSRPPSAEGLGKPAPKSLRSKTGRKPGRPKGQPGATLQMTDDPDEVVSHEPGCCSGCGNGMSGAPVTGTERRQVTDLPEVIRALVTEHRIVSRRCACGTVTSGAAPQGVTAPVQYGPRLSAAAVYLWHGQFLSRGRTCEAVSELFGVPVSAGAVAGMVSRVAGKLGGTLEAIRAALAVAGVAHADETGFRVAGKLAWVHSASSGKYVLITVHPKRGRQAMDAAGVIPALGGVLVHDAWAPYDTYGQLTHALCNAHALRELQAVIDASPDGQWCWAAQAADALREMKRLADASLAINGTLDHADQEKLARNRHRYRSAVLTGKNQSAARAGPLMRKHHALARRLLTREDDYLRFTTDPRVPFDNNAAEREIRMSKLRIKVSGCMREVPRAFRTVHPIGWAVWRGEVIAPTEEELLTGIQGRSREDGDRDVAPDCQSGKGARNQRRHPR